MCFSKRTTDNNNCVMEGRTNLSADLLKQLHEQYAINSNANLGSIIALITSVLVVMGYYGYAYIHTTPEFSHAFESLIIKDGLYYLDVLLLAFIVSSFILLFISCICIYQGVQQRKEQFIIDVIRRKKAGSVFEVLPQYYHPFNKKGLGIIQGLYGEFIKVIFIIEGFLILTTTIKVLLNTYYFSDVCCCGVSEVVLCIIVLLFVFFGGYWYYVHQIFSYIKIQVESLNKNPFLYSSLDYKYTPSISIPEHASFSTIIKIIKDYNKNVSSSIKK